MPSFNDRLKQLLLIGIIGALVIMLFISMKAFIPGILGAITLYILSREKYFQLTFYRKWRKGWTAGLFILFYLVILGVPVYLIILLLSPRIDAYLSAPDKYIDLVRKILTNIQSETGIDILSTAHINTFFDKISAFLPGLVNSTTNLLFNLALVLFLLYYLLINGKSIEQYLNSITPLKEKNLHTLVYETKKNIKANALGIPMISIIQGFIATIGYYIFHVPEFLIWGVLTGLFAFFPIVGTMIIWVPIDIYLYATGNNWQATGLLLYSLLVTGNADTLARMTLLKKIGNVHPVITIIGVISGLSLFGFIGLIFGPLLVSYIGVLFSIYLNEYITDETMVNTDKH
ncbi:AI-2E family transporter [Flavihumibacter fluvii]|uniref:AI-2E family transporter n=1 Tax=Flavihumibacter fluvii TaxID=2838157 RepID=UPI001BDF45D6|nr:AI-2E family transporter [Flavihumibacter fluvii]ULQ53953.1 AI-2E family transporter [Flavihumibacter fluvii]